MIQQFQNFLIGLENKNHLVLFDSETAPIFYIVNVKMYKTEGKFKSSFSIESMIPGDSSS